MKKIKLLSVFFTLVVSFVVLCVFLFSSIFFLSEQVPDDPDLESHSYRFLEIDYKNNEASEGIVFLPNELKENEFISYGDSEYKKEFLVSNFDDEQYECFGTCSCVEEGSTSSNNNNDRRTSTGGLVIFRGSATLLVAATAVIASNLAKDHFTETCLETLSEDGCDPTSVLSTVDECKPVKKTVYDEINKESSELGGERYFCYGNCVENWFLKEPRMIEKSSKFECEKLHKEGEVVMTYEDVNFIFGYDNTPPKPADLELKALHMFIRDQMVDFCMEHSHIDDIPKEEGDPIDDNDGGGINFSLERQSYLCHGTTLSMSDRKRHTKCVLVDPIIDKSSKKWIKFWEKKERWDNTIV